MFQAHWLQRLGLDAPPRANAQGLSLLVRRQLECIPFENVTVLCGGAPDLQRDALRRKLLDRRRGGYCLELNCLLAHGLSSAGFAVRHVLARVLWQRETPGPRTHHFLSVEIDGQPWIADAGFGGPGLTAPIPMKPAGSVVQTGGTYRVAADDRLGRVLSRQDDSGALGPIYAWTDEPVGGTDLDAANWLAATWPGSPFMDRLVASRHHANGRIALSNNRFSRYEDGMLQESVDLGDAARVIDCLSAEFHVDLTPAEASAVTEKLAPLFRTDF